ncbi:MAG: glycyl-radical enzyme activating protein [Clostridia bacterium]|nr:glycyl-radical enzyme activating protein [Clostridia bacterium]
MEQEVQASYVFNIQHYSLHDGPGIRTILFLKGCPMRCRWCCNPESQKYTQEISYVQNKCIGKESCGFCEGCCPERAISFAGKAVIDFTRCNSCMKCAAVCPAKAIKPEGRQYTVTELLDIVERDAVFYGHGNGGMTISGGEPLTHPAILLPLLREAKRRRIHTAIETCGQADYTVLQEAANDLDYILYDIKSMNPQKHKQYTGWDNTQILWNFEKLCEEYPDLPKKVRTPIIPGFNDSTEDVKKILDFLQDKPNTEYEPLPYHSFGKGKYKALGRPYEMGGAVLDPAVMEEISRLADMFHVK